MPAVFSTRKKGRKNLLKKKISRSFFECFLYSVTTFMKRGGSLWNNENIDIRGSHDALSWRFLTRNVAPNVSRSCAAFSAQFFGRILSKQTFPRCHPPSDQFLFFFLPAPFFGKRARTFLRPRKRVTTREGLARFSAWRPIDKYSYNSSRY